MREVGAVEVADRQFAEDVVEDRGRVLDAVVALNHPGGLELGKGEGVDEFLQRHAVLQTDGDRDGEVVHHGAETRPFLVHVDEDLAKLAVLIFAGAQVDLVPADHRLLGVTLAAIWHLFATRTGDFLDYHLFDDLFGQNRGLVMQGAAFQHLGGLVVILDQARGQGLGQFGAVAVKRVCLDPEGPAEFVGLLAVLDRGIVRHVDRLGDRAGDEALRRRHHGDVAFGVEETLALLAAGIGTVKDVEVLFLEVRRAFQRHGSADVIVGGVDLGARVAEVAQQVETGIVELGRGDTEGLLAEILPKGPLVEHETDVEGRSQRGVDLVQLALTKAVTDQRRVVDPRRIADGAVADRVGDDLFDLGRAIAEVFQGGGDRAVDDLEITAARELLELDQRKVRLDPRGVAIHDQTDRSGWRDDGGLGVAIAVQFTKAQCLVPAGFRQFDQRAVGAVGVIQRDGWDRQRLIGDLIGIGGGAVVADDAQHMLGVALISREGPEFAGHLGRGRIGDARHDCGERTGQCPALIAVIAIAHVHQQPADVRIAQTKRSEVVGKLRNLLGRELRHGDGDFQRQGPEAGGVHVVLGLKRPILEEGQQVHRCKVAGGIIQEHVFRTGI